MGRDCELCHQQKAMITKPQPAAAEESDPLAYAVTVTGSTGGPIAWFVYQDQAAGWIDRNYPKRATISVMPRPAKPQPAAVGDGEPLPCPFCAQRPASGASMDSGYVECRNESCPVRPSIGLLDHGGVGGFARALAVWNTRATPAPSAPAQAPDWDFDRLKPLMMSGYQFRCGDITPNVPWVTIKDILTDALRHGGLKGQVADEAPAQAVEFPDTVHRFEDMSPTGRLALHRQRDGDVVVTIIPDRDDTRDSFTRSVEFCTSGTQSPKTRRALVALMAAIHEENQTDPQYRLGGATQPAGEKP
jgi:hypothetical protein